MECTIYRSNFIQPITVREYYVELKSDHPIWEHIPRRRLWHKTLQECARLAFAIEMPNLRQSHFKKSATNSLLHQQTSDSSLDRKEQLKISYKDSLMRLRKGISKRLYST